MQRGALEGDSWLRAHGIDAPVGREVPDLPHMQRMGEWWDYAVSWSVDLGPHKDDPGKLKKIDESHGAGTIPPQAQASPPPKQAPVESPQT